MHKWLKNIKNSFKFNYGLKMKSIIKLIYYSYWIVYSQNSLILIYREKYCSKYLKLKLKMYKIYSKYLVNWYKIKNYLQNSSKIKN